MFVLPLFEHSSGIPGLFYTLPDSCFPRSPSLSRISMLPLGTRTLRRSILWASCSAMAIGYLGLTVLCTKGQGRWQYLLFLQTNYQLQHTLSHITTMKISQEISKIEACGCILSLVEIISFPTTELQILKL